MDKEIDYLDERVVNWHKTLDYIEKNNIKHKYSKKFGMSVPNFGDIKLIIRYLNNYEKFIEYVEEWSDGKEIKLENGNIFR